MQLLPNRGRVAISYSIGLQQDSVLGFSLPPDLIRSFAIDDPGILTIVDSCILCRNTTDLKTFVT